MIIFSHQLLHPQYIFFKPKKHPVRLILVVNGHQLCFVNGVLSRVPRVMKGGSLKVTNDDEGEGGGHDTPQK